MKYVAVGHNPGHRCITKAFDDAESRWNNDSTRVAGRAYRRMVKKKKDKKRRRLLSIYKYRPFLGYIEHDFIDGKWQETGSHIKYPKASNRQRFLKRQSNKMVRRYKGAISSGNAYKKIYDYWWKLY